MANLSKAELEQEEHERAIWRMKLEHKMMLHKEGKYECRICHLEFTFEEPCAEHDQILRKQNLAKFEEKQRKMDEDFKNASNPDKDPYNLWGIWKRLQNVNYIK